MTAAIVQVAQLLVDTAKRSEDNFILVMSKLNLMDLELQKITKRLDQLNAEQ